MEYLKVETEIEVSDEVKRQARRYGRRMTLRSAAITVAVGLILALFAFVVMSNPNSTLTYGVTICLFGSIFLVAVLAMALVARKEYNYSVGAYLQKHGTPVYIIPADAVVWDQGRLVKHVTEKRIYQKPCLVNPSLRFLVEFIWTWSTPVDRGRLALTPLKVELTVHLDGVAMINYWLYWAGGAMEDVGGAVTKKLVDEAVIRMNCNKGTFAQMPEGQKGEEMSGRLKRLLEGSFFQEYVETLEVSITRATDSTWKELP